MEKLLNKAQSLYEKEVDKKQMDGKEKEIELPKSFFPEALCVDGKEVHISFSGKIKSTDGKIKLEVKSYHCDSYEKSDTAHQ